MSLAYASLTGARKNTRRDSFHSAVDVLPPTVEKVLEEGSKYCVQKAMKLPDNPAVVKRAGFERGVCKTSGHR